MLTLGNLALIRLTIRLISALSLVSMRAICFSNDFRLISVSILVMGLFSADSSLVASVLLGRRRRGGDVAGELAFLGVFAFALLLLLSFRFDRWKFLNSMSILLVTELLSLVKADSVSFGSILIFFF